MWLVNYGKCLKMFEVIFETQWPWPPCHSTTQHWMPASFSNVLRWERAPTATYTRRRQCCQASVAMLTALRWRVENMELHAMLNMQCLKYMSPRALRSTKLSLHNLVRADILPQFAQGQSGNSMPSRPRQVAVKCFKLAEARFGCWNGLGKTPRQGQFDRGDFDSHALCAMHWFTFFSTWMMTKQSGILGFRSYVVHIKRAATRIA